MEFVLAKTILDKTDITDRLKISFFSGNEVSIQERDESNVIFQDLHQLLNLDDVLVDASKLFCRFVDVEPKGDIQLYTKDTVYLNGNRLRVYTPRWKLSHVYKFIHSGIHFYCLRIDVVPKTEVLKKNRINTI